jgi:hypothetical protein
MVEGHTVRIGCGSAYADDDLELAMDMLERGDIDYLAMDSLAERTLGLAQLRRRLDPSSGFDERLPEIAERVLPLALDRGVKVIGNMGAANPEGAGEFVAKAMHLHHPGVRIAVIRGDDVLQFLKDEDPTIEETGGRASALDGEIVSANAYLGCESIVSALADGAQIVIGGRIADPSLFVGPLAYEFGWSVTDWPAMGRATCIAHLLECGVYVTGGNYADPPFTPDFSLDSPSFPLASVRPDGSARIEKLSATGGLMSSMTCKLQLGYEIHDPRAYLTPDVSADFSNVGLVEEGGGVIVSGATGNERPPRLKVLVGVRQGYIGEGQVSFAGPGALERAQLARATVRRKVDRLLDNGDISEVRYDLLGLDSIHGAATPSTAPSPYELHLRVAARASDAKVAAKVALAVEHLQLFGPAGTSGHRRLVRPVLAMYTTFVDRSRVSEAVQMLET